MQDEYKLHSDHEILTGLRLDHHRDHGPILTPRFAWKWKTSSRSVFRLNIGTGFRVVNLFTEDHAALTGARKVVITEDLKPERSINVNMHYSQRFRLSGWSGNIEASLWHTRFSNRILPDYDSDPNMIFYRNLRGRSISRGISTNLEMQKGNRLRWMLGITWQDVFNKESGASKFRPMLVENWSGVWLFSVTFPRWRTTLDYSGSIYGPMRLPLLSEWDPRASTSPVWSQQQMQLSKKIGKGEVYLGIRNLLNWTPIRQTPFLIARAHDPFDKKLNYDANGKILATAENPFALSFDPTYMYAPNQGRRFYLGFRIALPAKNSKDN